MNDVERTSHAAARLEYHHSSGVQTIIAHARDLQDIRERWTVPTFMDGSELLRDFVPAGKRSAVVADEERREPRGWVGGRSVSMADSVLKRLRSVLPDIPRSKGGGQTIEVGIRSSS